MLERTEIECACGSETEKTKMIIRPLNPDVENSVPLVEIEIQGNKKMFLDADAINELVTALKDNF